MIRYVKVYISTGCNQYVIPNFNISNYNGISANPYIVSNYRSSFESSPVGLADGYAVCYVEIPSDDSFWVNTNITKVTYIKSFPNLRFRQYLNMKFVCQPFQHIAGNKSKEYFSPISACKA